MHLNEVRAAYPDLAERRVIHETVRRMINTLVTDLIAQTEQNIRAQTRKVWTTCVTHPRLSRSARKCMS